MKCKRCDVLLLGVVEKDTGICVVCQRHPQFMVPRAGDNAVPRAAAVTTTPLPLRTPAARPCRWDWADGPWVRSCEPGGVWEFYEGGPEENGWEYCPMCGLPLEVGAPEIEIGAPEIGEEEEI